jgi:hypothetical protein
MGVLVVEEDLDHQVVQVLVDQLIKHLQREYKDMETQAALDSILDHGLLVVAVVEQVRQVILVDLEHLEDL